MGQVRYIFDEPGDSAVIGRGVVPDELIELPDAVIQAHDWPERFWDVVESGRRVFDPADHTVAEVNDYLEDADDDERARVIAAERDGQARKGILDNAEGV